MTKLKKVKQTNTYPPGIVIKKEKVSSKSVRIYMPNKLTKPAILEESVTYPIGNGRCATVYYTEIRKPIKEYKIGYTLTRGFLKPAPRKQRKS